MLLTVLHKFASGLALLMIASYFTSSLIVEIFGSQEEIATVKTIIVHSLIILAFLMASTAISGKRLAKKLSNNNNTTIIALKQKRMKFIALNAILVLIPIAVVLYWLSTGGYFGVWFYGLQAVEFIAGGTNIYLMAMNAKLGKQLSSNVV